MKDLYERLAKVGVDAAFVRAHILPDWWDDSLGDLPVNRALAEGCVSKVLGLRIRDLRERGKVLRLSAAADVRLKKRKDTSLADLAPAIVLALRAARVLVPSLKEVEPCRLGSDAHAIRKEMLESRQFIDLDALVDLAWGRGIPVIHLPALPRLSRKFSALAAFNGDRPVIVLASGHDSPPWLAFHLAHELGHIFLGHVTPDQQPVADSNADRIENDQEEADADAFACTLLTGEPAPRLDAIYGLTSEKLVKAVREAGGKRKIDPGALALVYGRSADRMPVAQAALKLMGLDSGAHERISAALHEHLQEEIPEWICRFLSLSQVV